MKTEFENSIRRLIFLCLLMDIKIAWINPCIYAVGLHTDTHISAGNQTTCFIQF